MAEKLTIARPYAKAAYQYAREENQTMQWLSFLQQMVAVVTNSEFSQMKGNPKIKKDQFLNILESVFKSPFSDTQRNFIKILQDNGRISVVPEIAILFEKHLLQAEKKLKIKIKSAFPLTEHIKSRLTRALEIRLQNEIQFDVEIDPSLIGGIVIYADDLDLIIDGSVRHQLDKMKQFF